MNGTKFFRLFASISLVIAALILGGCTTFGVSNDQWNQLTPEQKKIVIHNYYIQKQHQAEIDRTNAENAPINNLIDSFASSLPSKTRTSGSSSTHSTTHCSGTSCWTDSNTSGSSTSIKTPF